MARIPERRVSLVPDRRRRRRGGRRLGDVALSSPLALIRCPACQTGTAQTVTITAVSSNPALIPTPVPVTYNPGDTTGNVTYTPVAGASGTATITVTVRDNAGTANGGANT